MAGCASAFLLESPVWAARVRNLRPWPALASTSFFLLVVDPVLTSWFPLHSRANAIVRLVFPTIEAFAISLTLLILAIGSRSTAYRVLNWRISRHVGKLSYSLYIWQQLFLTPSSATRLVSLLWRLFAIYVVSLSSYLYFERPLVKLRRSFRHGVSV